jgi:propanediol dehydratase large subunit
MNYSRLAQLVQELEQNGFEEEATNLADAMQTEASPDVIFTNADIISEMDEIVGGVLYHLNIDNNLKFVGNNLSPQSINDIKNSIDQIIKSA